MSISSSSSRRDVQREPREVLSLLANDDVEARASLADRFLFWLLKHPLQRATDFTVVFHVHFSTVCRQLVTLRRQKLIDTVNVSTAAPSRPEAVYYLTTTGVQRVADLLGGADAVKLARVWHADEAGLLQLLPRLHSHIPLQEVMYRLVTEASAVLTYDGRPAIIRWHWQRDYAHTFLHHGKHQLTCRVDGALVFERQPSPTQPASQDQTPPSWYCLLCLGDPGLFGAEDLHLMQQRLESLLLWRESRERWPVYHASPPLLIFAPTQHQRDLWIYCAQEAQRHLRLAPLQGASATMLAGRSPWSLAWHALDGSGSVQIQSLAQGLDLQALPPGLLAPKDLPTGMYIPGTKTHARSSVVIGHFHERTGSPLKKGAEAVSKAVPKKPTLALASLSLQLSYRHLTLLQHIYASPLTTFQELAALLRCKPSTLRRYLYDLYAMHCLEDRLTLYGKRVLLSEQGLRLMAACLHVPLTHIAVCERGERGERGAETENWQQRGVKQALRTIAHTAGIYSFLARLQHAALQEGQEMVWWETIRSMRRYRYQHGWHNLMPDALFAYQNQHQDQHVWLEWDTGSMHQPALITKFTAYGHYIRSRQYRQEHGRPPALLIVVPDTTREQLMHHCVAASLEAVSLTTWTTTGALLDVEGPLAPIWKRVDPSSASPSETALSARTTWRERLS